MKYSSTIFPFLIFFSLLFFSETNCYPQPNSKKIDTFLQQKEPSSSNKKNTAIEKKYETTDTVYASYINSIKAAAKKKEYEKAIAIAKKMFQFAQEQQDTLQMAKARYRQAYYATKISKLVEANTFYGQAIQYAATVNDKELLLSLYLNKADTERNLGDFFQAQQTAKKGLEFLEEGKDSLRHYKLNTSLGISCNDAQEYANATKAYAQGLQYATSFKQRASLLNNMAVNHKEQQNYAEAIKIYRGLLAAKELNNYPETKARVMDNLGYALFKTNNSDDLGFMETALAQRLQLEDWAGQFASNIHLADYYRNKNIPKGLIHAQNAMQIANRTKSPDWQMEALRHIIMLKKEPTVEAARYFVLKDSMERATQALRNEYISTKFFTEETDKENHSLKAETLAKDLVITQEKQKKIALYTVSGFLVLLLLGGIGFARQRQKNAKQKHQIATLKARERERNKISGNVHHSVAGHIRSAMAQVDHITTLHPHVGLENVGDLLETAYAKARDISHENQPMDFNSISFEKRLQQLLEEKENLFKFEIDAIGLNNIEWERVSDLVKTECFRTIQEALLNAFKHSKAHHVLIRFFREGKMGYFTVKDDGNGCEPAVLKENTGLADMRSRMASLNGTFLLETQPFKGFQLKIGFPLK